MRVIGPNVLGIIDTVANLNASFAAGMPRRGPYCLHVAVGRAVHFHSGYGARPGHRLFALLQHRQQGRPERNRFPARLVRRSRDERDRRLPGRHYRRSRVHEDRPARSRGKKPVVSIKSGTTSAGSRAASSHTGTLAGSEKAYDAAFKQVGIVRAGSVQDLFDYTQAFDRQPLPESDAVAVVTNAGGPGIMASDAIERIGMRLASLTPEIQQKLRAALPAAASVVNPIDVLGDAPADRYELAIEAALSDPQVGIVLVVLTPQTATQIPETARLLGELSRKYNKADLCSLHGRCGHSPGAGNPHRISGAQLPGARASRGAIAAMWNRRHWLNTPELNLEPLTGRPGQGSTGNRPASAARIAPPPETPKPETFSPRMASRCQNPCSPRTPMRP